MSQTLDALFDKAHSLPRPELHREVPRHLGADAARLDAVVAAYQPRAELMEAVGGYREAQRQAVFLRDGFAEANVFVGGRRAVLEEYFPAPDAPTMNTNSPSLI